MVAGIAIGVVSPTGRLLLLYITAESEAVEGGSEVAFITAVNKAYYARSTT